MINILLFVIAVMFFVDFAHLLQMEDYNLIRSVGKIGVKRNCAVDCVILFQGIVVFFIHKQFDNQTIDILLFLLLFINLLINSMLSYSKNVKNKTPIKITKRIKRLCFVYIVVYILTQSMLSMSKIYINLYLFNLYLLIIFILSYIFIFPIEKMIYLYYLSKAIKKLKIFKELKIIAITGSFGKTSTKNILFDMLSTKYNVLKSPASFNTPMGICRTILEELKPHHEILILEFGAKKRGEIRYLCRKFRPSFGILTSIGKQHISSFGSFGNVIKTKMELQQNLRLPKFMVFNCDNSYVCEVSECFDCDCAKTSIIEKIDDDKHAVKNDDYVNVSKLYFGVDLKVDQFGSCFSVMDVCSGKSTKFSCKLLGRHNVSNILCAYAMARYFDVSDADIARVLMSISYPPHRLEKKVFDDKIILDNSYNSNPSSILCSLDVLSMFEGRTKVVITPGIVEQGDEMYIENKKIGASIASVADEVLIVNKLNRAPITAGLLDAGYNSKNIKYFDKFSEIDLSVYSNGEVVLIENDLPDNFN